MRRWVAVFIGGALVPAAVAGPTQAGGTTQRPQQRVETVSYEPNPQQQIVIDPGAVTGSPGVSVTTVRVYPRRGESWLSVKAVDDSGHAVRVDVDQRRSHVGRFCEGSNDPVAVHPGEPVTLEVFSGSCGGGVNVATTGTLEVTFSRRAGES